MQYQETDCSGIRAAMLEADLACLWPSSTPEDIIRRKLASILIEDPAHRLRVAHLEPLLQLALGPQQLPCSSGRLQALLTDPSTAKIFPVDFSAQVADWRSRVVFLDLPQLSQNISAAKLHHHQQQADASTVDQDGGSRLERGSSSGCSESAALSSHMLSPDAGANAALQLPHSASAGVSQRPAPLALETIFGTSPAYGGLPGAVDSNGYRTSVPHPSHSMPGSDGRGGSMAGGHGPPGGSQQAASTLFGGSFEVPHAIASCWADHQGSFGSTAGVRHPVLDSLAVGDGCGSSSMASGSSAHSTPGAAAAAAGQAGTAPLPARPPTGSSRLRNASTCPTEGGEGTQADPAPANSIDVCTPRSGLGAAAGGADRSPLLSCADGDEDAEYSEAALVFGSVNAAVDGREEQTPGKVRGDPMQTHAVLQEEGSAAAMGAGGAGGGDRDPAGHFEAEESFCMQGVDWSCMAGLQEQHQQQSEAAFHYQQQQQQQALLFGLDDFGGDGLTPRSSSGGGAAATPSAAAARARSNALSAAATGALTARRLLMEHAGLREDCTAAGMNHPNYLLGSSHHSPHHMAALAGSLGQLGAGSAPANLQQQRQHEQLLLAAAAAAGGGGALGGYGSLLDPDMLNTYGMSGSQHHMAALASSLQGGSYGSGGFLGSDRSLGSGFWASPAAMQQQYLLQQQRQQAVAAAAVVAAAAAAQSQQQQMRGSLGGAGDGTIDTSFRMDQIGKGEQQHPIGSAGGSGSAPGKVSAVGAFGRSLNQGEDHPAERGSNPGGAGAAGSALMPRLTGWASIAAKEPPAGTQSAQQQQQQGANGSAGGSVQNGMRPQQGGVKGVGDAGQGKAVAKLPARVKAEVQNLVTQFQGVLKLEDFDDGVVHQLNAKRSEDEAVAAVRHIAHYELGTIQHMAAYLNHLVKHYNHNAAAAAAAAAAADTTVGLSNALAAAAAAAVAANTAAAVHGGGATAATMQQLLGAGMLGGNGTLGSTVGAGRGAAGGGGAVGGAAGLGAYGGQIRLASVPVSTKAMLQKLPLKVFKQIELLVQNCAYLEWRHFDAGVIKVLSQLSKLCEGDVFEELELLAATDLSNVEYMPAYLNKRLNNKLWSRRKADGHVAG